MQKLKECNNPKFRELNDRVSSETIQAIKKMGFKRMTDIQTQVLPKALCGMDIVATAKTGSGKTLAFLIPVVEVVKSLEMQSTGTYLFLINYYYMA